MLLPSFKVVQTDGPANWICQSVSFNVKVDDKTSDSQILVS